MSDLVAELDKVKKDIRSLLISAPNGLTPHMLEKDYLTVTSKPIPCTKFGFSNCLDFFRSLNDTLTVTIKHNQIVLLGIADQSTEHILKMVQKQKKAKFYTSVNVSTQSIQKKKFTNYCKYPTALTRSGIVKVLRKYPNGFSITKLHDYYKEINGTTLDVNGIQTIPSFIRYMPDIALLDYGKKEKNGNNLYIFPSKTLVNIPTHSSRTLSPKLASNTPSSNNCGNSSITPSSSSVSKNNISSDVTNQSKKNNSKTLGETNPGRPGKTVGELPETAQLDLSSNKGVESNFNSNKQSTSKSSTELFNLSCRENTNFSKISVKADDDLSEFDESTPPSSVLLKQEIISLLKEHNTEIRSIKLPNLYKKKYKKDLNLHNHGYYSIIELISTMTDKISMCRVNRTGDWILKLRDLLPDRNTDSSKADQVDKAAQLVELEKEIKELLNRYKGGIAVGSLEDLYEMHFNRPLPLKEQSVNSAPELICKIADTIDLSNGHLCIQSSFACDTMRKQEPSIQSAPLDAVGFGVKYHPPYLPTVQWGYFSCYVTYVNNPSDFRIQVIGDDTTAAFNKLMDEIEKTYNHRTGKAYRIPPHMIVPGQVCVAIYHGDNNWNRAVIEDFPAGGFVKVRYVDYGDIASVSTGAIYFLKQKYHQLPILEVHAKLASVQPANYQTWDIAARKLLVDFSKNRELTAKVIEEVECNGHTVFSLELCDVSSYDDIYLTDLLLQKGLAVGLCDDDLSLQEIEELFKRNALNGSDKKKSSVPKESPPPYQETIPPLAGSSNSGPPQQLPLPANLPPLVVPPPPPGFGNVALQRNRTADEISQLLEKLKNQQDALKEIEQTQKAKDLKQKKKASKPSRPKLQKRYLKRFRLIDDLDVHVVNFKGNALLLSGEISRIFRPDSEDILVPLLMMREIHEDFPELDLVCNDETQLIFDEFVQSQVKDVFKSDGFVKPVVTLYRLTDVPEMVAELEHQDKEVVISRLQEIVANFDPNSDYWYKEAAARSEMKTKNSSSNFRNSDSDEACCSASLNKEANHQKLKKNVGHEAKSPENKQELQLKRDTLLRQLMTKNKPSQKVFNQLKDVMKGINELGEVEKNPQPTSSSSLEESCADMSIIPSDETILFRNFFAEIRPTFENPPSLNPI